MGYYWGIHTHDCPSIAQLRAMAQENCYYIGYYLAPTRNGCCKNMSYMGKRSAILEAGLNPVPIYLANSLDNNVGADEGSKDALDAVALVKSEGFKEGTYIFLGIKKPCVSGKIVEINYQAYVRRWVEIVNENKFKAGIYASASYAVYFRASIDYNMEARYWLYELTRYVGNRDTQEVAPSPASCGNYAAFVWHGFIVTWDLMAIVCRFL